MIVYLAEAHYDYDGSVTLGVFSTMELGKKACLDHLGNMAYGPLEESGNDDVTYLEDSFHNYSVTKIEVDVPLMR